MPRRCDEGRRDKYTRSAQAWLALVAHATHRRTVTDDALGALLQPPHEAPLRPGPLDDVTRYHAVSPEGTQR